MARLLLLILLLIISVWFVSLIVPFGQVDPFALVVGVVAIWFVWQETRRNNTPVVHVLQCEGSTVHQRGRNDVQSFQQFRVLLHNRGISLWNVTVKICFNHENYGGTCFYELTPTEQSKGDHAVEFARGMLAEYELTSKNFSSPHGLWMRDSLIKLKNARKQQAKICVYSQGFLAYSISIGNSWDRMKGRWNRFAWWGKEHFKKEIERPGLCPLVIYPRFIPTFFTLEDKLMYFVWALKQEASREQESP